MEASPTPWLDLAKADIGQKEIPGQADNPDIMSYYTDAGCPVEHEDTPWCAAFVGATLKRAGYPNTRSLAARSYCTYGTALEQPREGCIVVMTRGKNTWEGHVGFYVGGDGGHVSLLGGNQGDAVSISSFPKDRVIAYRWPVAPTVPELRQAGSTEIKAADAIQAATVAGGAVTAGAEVVKQLAPTPDSLIDELGVMQKMGEAVRNVGELASAHWYVAAAIVLVAVYFFARRWKLSRVRRAALGLPLSQQVSNA